jgi:uncharacterized protein (UPF0333 family)
MERRSISLAMSMTIHMLVTWVSTVIHYFKMSPSTSATVSIGDSVGTVVGGSASLGLCFLLLESQFLEYTWT